MADLSGTTKIETLMIMVCWTEFHIKTIKEVKWNISLKILH